MNPMLFIILILATWRLTHLLAKEDGPCDLVFRMRKSLGNGLLGKLMDCFYCLSLWIAVPFALYGGHDWVGRLLLWLALSGATCLLERIEFNYLSK